MEEWISKNGVEDSYKFLRTANALVMKYGDASGALACKMYDEVAVLEGKTLPPAEIADLPSFGEVAKAVNGAKKQSVKKVPGTVGRLVKQRGADTTLKNALRDRAQFAWIPSGDTCAFCITLASRGWQYMSKEAFKNGHAEHIHANCDCQFAIRLDGESGVEGYDPEVYLEMYENAKTEGKYNTSEEAVRNLRRRLINEKTSSG